MADFFNKKWFDKKAEENNPKLPSLQEMQKENEEYFNAYQAKSLEIKEQERKEYLRLKAQAEMNQKMYGQTTTPNGLYSVNANQFTTTIAPGQILQYNSSGGVSYFYKDYFYKDIVSEYPELEPLSIFLNAVLYIKDKGRHY